MPRPKKNRIISNLPASTTFLPEGEEGELQKEKILTLSLDELEALRLADLEGLYHQHAAEHMQVSRQTFGNILNGARRKIAECLILGKGLHIEGGTVEMEGRSFRCKRCRHSWGNTEKDPLEPQECPACQSRDIQNHLSDPSSDPSSCCRGHRKRGFRGQKNASSPRDSSEKDM